MCRGGVSPLLVISMGCFFFFVWVMGKVFFPFLLCEFLVMLLLYMFVMVVLCGKQFPFYCDQCNVLCTLYNKDKKNKIKILSILTRTAPTLTLARVSRRLCPSFRHAA